MIAYINQLNIINSKTRKSNDRVRRICIFLILGIQILAKQFHVLKNAYF